MSDKLMALIKGEAFRTFIKSVLDRKAARGREAITPGAARKLMDERAGKVRVSVDHALLAQLRALPTELRAEIEPKLAFTLQRLKASGKRALADKTTGAAGSVRRAELAKAVETPEAWAEYWARPIDPITGGCIVACIVVCGMVVVWLVVEECFPAPKPPPKEECVETEVEVETEVCEEECEEQCPND